jgi:hypothetical protein
VRLNGKSVATKYQPSSYVEIPKRKWSTKDVVEVVMPFGNHLDYTPDKMEVAGGKSFKPAWTAALMRGPLVMAATGIGTWEEATVQSAAELSRFNFVPDYDADRNVTHYFRIESAAKAPTTIDTLVLRQTLAMAEKRVKAQDAWNQMEVKVPEYAPWAPYGYARMQEQLAKARRILANHTAPVEAEKTLSMLNAALSSMRPGNLAEPEDMQELKSLMEQASHLPHNDVNASAIRKAQRVVRYVTDGSGTHDMIDRSVSELKTILDIKN